MYKEKQKEMHLQSDFVVSQEAALEKFDLFLSRPSLMSLHSYLHSPSPHTSPQVCVRAGGQYSGWDRRE